MKAVGTILGVVSIALVCSGCIVAWQANAPGSYGQCHSRGSSYNALATKALSPSGDCEAIQQQRATTTTGDALGTSVEASKATDLSAATRQGQVATETAKGVANGTGTSSGDMTPTNSPKNSTSKAATTAVAQTGAVAKGQAPNESDGNVVDAKADAQTIADLQADVDRAQAIAEQVGSGGGENGADTPAQALAKKQLADAQARLAAAKK